MNKLKGFLFNLFIGSGFIGGLGGFILGMGVLFACFFCIGLVTYSICGIDMLVECSKFEKILVNGIFMGVGIMIITMVIVYIVKIVKVVKNAWEDAG